MSKRKYSEQQAEWAKRRSDMKELVAAGWSYAKIGRRYKRSRQRIAQMLGGSK